LVGGDVVYCVGCGLGCVYHDVARESAVDVGREPQVEVGLWPGDGGVCWSVVVVTKDHENSLHGPVWGTLELCGTLPNLENDPSRFGRLGPGEASVQRAWPDTASPFRLYS
jgi:hypothetical protein